MNFIDDSFDVIIALKSQSGKATISPVFICFCRRLEDPMFEELGLTAHPQLGINRQIQEFRPNAERHAGFVNAVQGRIGGWPTMKDPDHDCADLLQNPDDFLVPNA